MNGEYSREFLFINSYFKRHNIRVFPIISPETHKKEVILTLKEG